MENHFNAMLREAAKRSNTVVQRVCLLVEGRGSRVTSRGSRVNGRGSRVTSRGSKHSSQLFLNVGKSKFRVTCVSGFCFILHTMCFLACSRLSLVGTS